MVNLILNSVTKQLGKTFGNSYRYYVEDVEQGLKKPCFTVDALIPLQRRKSPLLYDRTMPIVVHYFSDSERDVKNHYYTMGESIVESLELLPVENTLLRGEDISWQIVDDVLQVFVTYKFTTMLKTNAEESFETIESNISHGE